MPGIELLDAAEEDLYSGLHVELDDLMGLDDDILLVEGLTVDGYELDSFPALGSLSPIKVPTLLDKSGEERKRRVVESVARCVASAALDSAVSALAEASRDN
jgi:hypothetical protein